MSVLIFLLRAPFLRLFLESFQPSYLSFLLRSRLRFLLRFRLRSLLRFFSRFLFCFLKFLIDNETLSVRVSTGIIWDLLDCILWVSVSRVGRKRARGSGGAAGTREPPTSGLMAQEAGAASASSKTPNVSVRAKRAPADFADKGNEKHYSRCHQTNK